MNSYPKDDPFEKRETHLSGNSPYETLSQQKSWLIIEKTFTLRNKNGYWKVYL
jgi:hypothetical protein